MLRYLVPLLIMVFTGVAAAESQTLIFKVNIPKDWQVKEPSDAAIKLMVISPRIASTGGNCNFIVNDMPKLVGVSQAQINEAGTEAFTEAFWRKELEAAKMTNVRIEKSGTRDQGDRRVFYARWTSDMPVDGGTISMTGLQDLHVVPGRGYVVTCAALSEAVDQEEADFAYIMNSFEPSSEVPTAALSPSGPASLTLYDRARYSGVSRVITQDTADLTQFGWSRTAASFSTAGSDAWEVCDSANFTGNCRTLSGNVPTLPAFAALSARRVPAGRGDLSDLVNTAAASLTASTAITRARH